MIVFNSNWFFLMVPTESNRFNVKIFWDDEYFVITDQMNWINNNKMCGIFACRKWNFILLILLRAIRQIRFSTKLSRFNFKIQYHKTMNKL